MTAAEDREKRAAVDALVHRLRNRGDADDEPFAAEFIAALWGRGWRPVEALRPAADWRMKPQRTEPPPEYLEARAKVDEKAAVAQAARRGKLVAGEVIREWPAIDAPPPQAGSP